MLECNRVIHTDKSIKMLEYNRVIHTEVTEIINDATLFGKPIKKICVLRLNDFTTIKFSGIADLYHVEVGNVVSFYPMNFKVDFFKKENEIHEGEFELKIVMSQLELWSDWASSSYNFFHVFESNKAYFRTKEGFIEDSHHVLDVGSYFVDVHSNFKNLSLKEFSKWHKNTYSHLSPNQLYEKMIERYYL